MQMEIENREVPFANLEEISKREKSAGYLSPFRTGSFNSDPIKE